MNNLGLVFILALLEYTSGQNANCDYSQNIQPGQTYYVSSPNYPNNYVAGVQCRWIATCPTDYNCRLDCNVQLPQSQSCSMDRLLISKTGDSQLASADYYCGSGTLTAVSTGRQIVIGLISSYNSPGGWFMCQLRAQSASPNVPCSCGYKRQNRIVGGVETGVNEFPMMAALVDARIEQVKCGAVIIDNMHLLTAAHCLDNQAIGNFLAVVGEHNIKINDTSEQGIRLAAYLKHPQYTNANYDYDIAIVRLQQPILFTDRVGPVCLPFKFTGNSFAGSKVTLLGWGTLYPGGPKMDYLQKVDVDVISQSSCLTSSPNLTPRQICTYTPGKDACQDDSGGPVLYTDPSTGLLFCVGVISFGRFCASGEPGINTRVTELLSWITANTHNNYCRK